MVFLMETIPITIHHENIDEQEAIEKNKIFICYYIDTGVARSVKEAPKF